MNYIQQAVANVQAMYKISPRTNEPVKQQLARTLAERNAKMLTLTDEQIAAHKKQLLINQGVTSGIRYGIHDWRD